MQSQSIGIDCLHTCIVGWWGRAAGGVKGEASTAAVRSRSRVVQLSALFASNRLELRPCRGMAGLVGPEGAARGPGLGGSVARMAGSRLLWRARLRKDEGEGVWEGGSVGDGAAGEKLDSCGGTPQGSACLPCGCSRCDMCARCRHGLQAHRAHLYMRHELGQPHP